MKVVQIPQASLGSRNFNIGPNEGPSQGEKTVTNPLNFQQFARLCHPSRGPAILARGDARESDELPPAEYGPRGVEFLGYGSIILFRMKRAILADGITEK